MYRISDITRKGEELNMGCGCSCGGEDARIFLTKEEKISRLKAYKETLEQEARGVSEKIKDLEKAK